MYSTQFIINSNFLKKNIEYIKKFRNKKILSVVKANAYGHGIEEITKLLYNFGEREFAVARLIEAKKIIALGLKNIKILVFESIDEYDYVLKNKEIIVSINTLNELYDAVEHKISLKQMHIKVDFGFGRNGLSVEEIKKLKKDKFFENKKFGGIYSHLFAVNYEDGLEYIEKFKQLLLLLGKNNFFMIHLQNSAAILSYDCEFVTHVRAGMAIYGLQDEGFYDENLLKVFSLESNIAGIKNLQDQKYIAYREKNSVIDGKYIAKVKIGYADGFLKINEGSYCLIGKKEYKILQITMDNTFIEVDSSVKVGDRIVFFHDVSKVTIHNNMTIYEMLTIISQRIKRVIK